MNLRDKSTVALERYNPDNRAVTQPLLGGGGEGHSYGGGVSSKWVLVVPTVGSLTSKFLLRKGEGEVWGKAHPQPPC